MPDQAELFATSGRVKVRGRLGQERDSEPPWAETAVS
jgi:hypothetical protein